MIKWGTTPVDDAINQAVAAERERCALIVEATINTCGCSDEQVTAAVAAIRDGAPAE